MTRRDAKRAVLGHLAAGIRMAAWPGPDWILYGKDDQPRSSADIERIEDALSEVCAELERRSGGVTL